MPLFVGAVPRETIEQVFGVVDLKDMRSAWICCSGSFRLEQALAKRFPDVPVHSNDISLLSTAVARHALGDPLDLTFKGKLAFLEEHIDSPLDRLGALAVAVEMAAFTSPNPYAHAHYKHYQDRVALYIREAGGRLQTYMDALNLASFACVDFRKHAAKAAEEEGAHIFAWPPTYKGGYEKIYKFVDDNSDWERPGYDVFEPKQLAGWMDGLDDQGAAYTVCADHEIDGREATGYFKAGRARSVYLFTSRSERSSVRKRGHKSTPFRYQVIEPSELTADSVVQVVSLESGHINFLKDRYLSVGLEHTAGIMSFGVLVGGALAGAFIYQPSDRPWKDPRIEARNTVYLLSDFSVSRERKLSKLVAMLATGQESIRQFDLKRLQRTQWLITTAFTDRPVSMKYRGIYELLTRKPGALNYISEVRRESNQQIYAAWWRRYAAKN